MGNGLGFLKYHADPLTKLHDINIFSINIDIVIEYLSFDANIGHEIVHPVQTAEKSGLAAAGWSNERSNFFLRNFQAYVFKSLLCSVPETQIV